MESINSNSYWNDRFEIDWESNKGPEQSRFFSRIAIDHSPTWLIDEIRKKKLTLADWGCAEGDGTAVWANYIDPSQITGIDFSSVAIKKALQHYPAIRFISENWLDSLTEQKESFDIVFSSNTLEHFYQPYNVLNTISNHAKKSVVLILPYEEHDRIKEHFSSFLPENIPLVLKNGFRLVWSKIIDCRELPNTLWGGDQIVLIYASSNWINTLWLTLKDLHIEQVSFEASINQITSKYEQQLYSLNQTMAEYDSQIAGLKQTISQYEIHIANLDQTIADSKKDIGTLSQHLAERDNQIANLDQRISDYSSTIIDINNQLTTSNLRINELVNSTSWLATAPIRVISQFVRSRLKSYREALSNFNIPAIRIFNYCGKLLIYLATRYRDGIRRHGLFRSIPLSISTLYRLSSNWFKKNILRQRYEQQLQTLTTIIDNHQSFIDLFHIPMGWNTPLFQRFQHMSIQASRLGGLALYGAHRHVDKDLFVFKQVQQNLIIFDALDTRVVDCIFNALRKTTQKKVLRIQSIDLVTRLKDIQQFIIDGFTVIYEYIDEIDEAITGPIPDFVKQRHLELLKDERILVIATSDKLYNVVGLHRTGNYLLSTNGVDIDHWQENQKILPSDIESVIKSGLPIVGYHGAFAKWLDYELIHKIANSNLYEVLLIGYEHDTSLTDSGLKQHPHVHFLGSKSYFTLNQYVAYYQIGILPFRRYTLTESVSPVKIFEYMAAGKPIVSSDIPECTKYRSCLVSDTHDTFLKNLHIALANKHDKAYNELLVLEARENSWLEKAKAVYQLAGIQIVKTSSNDYKKVNSFNSIHSDTFASWRKKVYQILRYAYWHSPLSNNSKEIIVRFARILSRISRSTFSYINLKPHKNQDTCNAYIKQVLSIPEKRGPQYIDFTTDNYIRHTRDPKILAYYLPQFHPTLENDTWWGRGTTEWNNVSRAVPQYVGHYQPRLPGELGYYDLRIKSVMQRQIELAKMYGIYGLVFYHYWFDNYRVLDKPINMFLENHDFDIPFCLCWVNESWTRRFDGSSGEILLKQNESVESYIAFIESTIPYMRDQRYIRIGNRPVLIIYRPSFIPECINTLNIWRKYCSNAGVGEPYIIGVKEHSWDTDLLLFGFDAQSEFHPGTLFKHCKNITNQLQYVNQSFSGLVYDYRDIVLKQKYFNYTYQKLYRSVMPMWDNTARRNNAGLIFEGASPALYKQWLKDMIKEAVSKNDLDEPYVFINAWNEWGEGAYIEPDSRYGYAFLQATKEAIEECR